MKPIHTVYAASAVLHVVGALALNQLQPKHEAEIVAISMTTIEQEKKKEEEKPKEEPKPEAAPRPAPKAAPVQAEPEAAPPAAPDFGFVMSGGGGGPGGIAVGPKVTESAPKVTKKVLSAAVAVATEDCSAGEVKAKATNMPHPTYTEDARAAAIEGKVRVQLTVSADGVVTDAVVIEGLGHGLDEAAIAALKEAKFTPASMCGKPVASTFTVSVRFAL